MKPWKVELFGALLLIFLAGAAAGGVVIGLYDRHRLESPRQGDYPAVVRKMILDRLTHELALEAGQRREMETIIQETQADLKELRSRYRPEAEALIAKGVVKMKSRLAPGQQARLEQLIAQEKQRRREDGK